MKKAKKWQSFQDFEVFAGINFKLRSTLKIMFSHNGGKYPDAQRASCFKKYGKTKLLRA